MTILLVLRTVTKKGEGNIEFPRMDRAYSLEVGDALLLYNTLPNGNMDVTAVYGENAVDEELWIATKWIREKPYYV